jgi:hypothetical protein
LADIVAGGESCASTNSGDLEEKETRRGRVCDEQVTIKRRAWRPGCLHFNSTEYLRRVKLGLMNKAPPGYDQTSHGGWRLTVRRMSTMFCYAQDTNMPLPSLNPSRVESRCGTTIDYCLTTKVNFHSSPNCRSATSLVAAYRFWRIEKSTIISNCVLSILSPYTVGCAFLS